MSSVVNVYLPGNFGGDALADILSGKVNPSGKLPYTYPLYPNSLLPYYYKPSEVQNNAQGAYNYVGEVNNLYDFGFGLSYSECKYNVALVKGRPKTLNLKDLIQNYVEHRHEVVTRRTDYELREAEKRSHILQGYIIALDNIDDVIDLFRRNEIRFR